MASYIGLRTPAQFTAIGKVLIAAQPAETWARHYRELPAPTEHTIVDHDEFLAELERVRQSGYALDREENEVGIRCVAAPVHGPGRDPLAAVSISGATVYISDERQRELVPEILACADEISRKLGGGGGG
jgi:DNA-binding IclR family transcriptional regulator